MPTVAASPRIFELALPDLALARGGSFYLTYHRFARRDQILRAHPRIGDFLARKLAYDPEERFQSEWYRSLRESFAARRRAA